MLDVLSETISSDNQAYSIWYNTKMKFKYFLPKRFETFLQECRMLFSYHEPVLYYSVPYNGMERRIEQVIQDYKGTFSSPLIHIHLTNAFEDSADIDLYLRQNDISIDKNPVNIFISNVDYLVKTRNGNIIPWLIQKQTINPYIGLIFFSETYLSRETVSMLGSLRLVTNIHYFPLFASDDARIFAQYLTNKWHMSLSETELHYIVKHCGGHLWLVKQAVRILRDDREFSYKDIYDHEAIVYRLSALYEVLSEEEKDLIVNPQKTLYPDSKKHLEKLGLIKKDVCTIPFLSKYLQYKWKRIEIVMNNSTVLFNNIPVNNMFSRTELRILKNFLSHKGKPVSRDDIARLMWPNDEEGHYSDWAIDQVIKRLRNKLQKFGVGSNAISTMRSFGYLFNY